MSRVFPMADPPEKKFAATVKVMRSHDYCHFEACLGAAEPMTIDEIDDMRKHAAVLVDEAVRQYRIAKAKEASRQTDEYERRRLEAKVEQIKAKPGSEWTPEEAAIMRTGEDGSFWEDFEDDDYCYSDPERDHHFSMLRKFKDEYKARVMA